MEVNKKVSEIEIILKANGYKYTHTRFEIVQLFVTTTEHIKAKEVYERLRAHGVSLSTVYRNIDILKRLGIIKEVVIHNEQYYELNIYSKKKLHIHFRCHQCGQIKEYTDIEIFREMIRQKEAIEQSYHDVIYDITIVMEGICSECNQTNMI